MVAAVIGLFLGLVVGAGCRFFDIPSPAPPVILGALLVMAMTVASIGVDRWMGKPARQAANSGGPCRLAPSQALPGSPEP